MNMFFSNGFWYIAHISAVHLLKNVAYIDVYLPNVLISFINVLISRGSYCQHITVIALALKWLPLIQPVDLAPVDLQSRDN